MILIDRDATLSVSKALFVLGWDRLVPALPLHLSLPLVSSWSTFLFLEENRVLVIVRVTFH